MKAATYLFPSHRLAAALAAAITTFVVVGTVVLIFDTANPAPEPPVLMARNGAPAARPAVAPRRGERDRTMVAAHVDSPAPAR